MCKTDYRKFRVMEGAQRRRAVRIELSQGMHAIDFTADVMTLSQSQRGALSDMAKAVGYRKPITSMHTLGGAFFCYLSRDVKEATPGRITPGGKWDNHNLARG